MNIISCGGLTILSYLKKKEEFYNSNVYLYDERLFCNQKLQNYHIYNKSLHYTYKIHGVCDTYFQAQSIKNFDLALISFGDDGHFASFYLDTFIKYNISQIFSNTLLYTKIKGDNFSNFRVTNSLKLLHKTKRIYLFFKNQMQKDYYDNLYLNNTPINYLKKNFNVSFILKIKNKFIEIDE